MTFPFRVGLGHDTHRFAPGDSLRIGGVSIPYDHAFLAHSDGDVLLHAVIDSLLGAGGMGDIGDMFPDTAECNRGRDSGEMLELVLERLRQEGWNVVNLDTIVFAQRPRLAGWKEKIRTRLAQLLRIDESAVNVKAKTGESVGVIGRGEAISAQAVVLLGRDLDQVQPTVNGVK